MLIGAINNKNVRLIEVAKEFGWQAALRTCEARYSKAHYTFLDVIFKGAGLRLNNIKPVGVK